MWKPGESGNPSGRSKEFKEIRALARENSPEAIMKLVEWMRSDNAKASVAACNAILDRGFGKPSQQVEHEVGEALARMVEMHIIDHRPKP